METPNIDNLFEEINRLKTGVQLLEELWSELGPYVSVPIKLSYRINKFLGHDDSEWKNVTKKRYGIRNPKMKEPIGDLSLGMDNQSMEVLKLLAKEELNHDHLVFLRTQAWYNGREKGFVITAYTPNTIWKYRILHLAVFEHRNIDQICVLKWQDGETSVLCDYKTLNAAYHGGGKYDVDAIFNCGEYRQAADYVKNAIIEYTMIEKLDAAAREWLHIIRV